MFTSNFPNPDAAGVLPTPARVGALSQYTGRGVVMAFIDSGFFPHPDLGERVLIHADATSNHVMAGRQFYEAGNYSWHGQMTSVIAAGDGRMSGGRYRGIAPDAQLVLIKVSNVRGQVKEADILRGLCWLLDHHTRFGVRVVNISVGGDFPSRDPDHPLHRVVRDLAEAGLILTIAAGNAGRAGLLPPASAPEALVIGGYDDRNTTDVRRWQPYHNSYGLAWDGSHKPDLLAAGAWIASPILPGSNLSREARWLAALLRAGDMAETRRLLRLAYADLGLRLEQVLEPDLALMTALQKRIHANKIVDEYHQHVDGTSVASAIAASVVAQMLEANPRLSPPQVGGLLKATARRFPAVPAEQQGAGLIDADAAVRAASAAAAS